MRLACMAYPRVTADCLAPAGVALMQHAHSAHEAAIKRTGACLTAWPQSLCSPSLTGCAACSEVYGSRSCAVWPDSRHCTLAATSSRPLGDQKRQSPKGLCRPVFAPQPLRVNGRSLWGLSTHFASGANNGKQIFAGVESTHAIHKLSRTVRAGLLLVSRAG